MTTQLQALLEHAKSIALTQTECTLHLQERIDRGEAMEMKDLAILTDRVSSQLSVLALLNIELVRLVDGLRTSDISIGG